jgi:hypothetical protein
MAKRVKSENPIVEAHLQEASVYAALPELTAIVTRLHKWIAQAEHGLGPGMDDLLAVIQSAHKMYTVLNDFRRTGDDVADRRLAAEEMMSRVPIVALKALQSIQDRPGLLGESEMLRVSKQIQQIMVEAAAAGARMT